MVTLKRPSFSSGGAWSKIAALSHVSGVISVLLVRISASSLSMSAGAVQLRVTAPAAPSGRTCRSVIGANGFWKPGRHWAA